MNKRELKLKKYGISGKRYKELSGFCEQYPEWIDELKYKADIEKKKEIINTQISEQSADNQAGEFAIHREALQKKRELVEQTAIETDPDLYEYIIKSVCYETPYWYLRDIMGMPCGERTFYDNRRYFFYLLDKNKKI